MNLTALWSGNDYAYYSMRGRGETWRPGATRVRVLRAYKKREIGNERDSGYALVLRVEPDGSVNPDAKEYEVRARDIAMRWEEYEDERDHREANRARMEADREAAVAADNDKKERIIVVLEEKGIKRNWINSITDYDIKLNRHVIERELSINGH